MPSEEYPPSSDEESDFLSRSNPTGNVHFLPPRFDEILEINVESLLGTTFELRLSANTTIGRIKSRLQGSEGIAKQHLHLLHRGVYHNILSDNTFAWAFAMGGAQWGRSHNFVQPISTDTRSF